MQQVPSPLPRSLPALLTRIRLQNVRGFRDLDISLTGGSVITPRLIALIVGKNGTNKSTLLRAIALCVADTTEAASLLSQPVGSIVRAGADIALIQLDFIGSARLLSVPSAGGTTGRSYVAVPRRKPWTYTRTITSSGGKDSVADHDVGTGGRGVFVCGYGAGRSNVGSDAGRDYRVDDACASLFDYRRDLLHHELTLRRLQDYLGDARYQRMLLGIKRVLDMGPDDQIELSQGGGVVVKGPSFGAGVPLDGWADGYRLTFLWMLDLYGRAMRANRIEPDGTIRGIVLIDEIDQHLHPSLQAAILPRLTELLPGMQIIATTHSPLVALGADPQDLVVLRRKGDQILVEEHVPDYRGYSAEDMLADDRLFDSPVYAPETQRQLERYDELVAKGPSRRTKKEEQELAKLAAELQAQPLPPSVDDKLTEALAEIRGAAAAEV